MFKVTLILTALLLVQGCATKNYGRQGELTSYESTTMNCREVALELAKVEGFQDKVNREGGKIDTRAVLGFLGDFGIGNSMERSAALKSAMDRKKALKDIQQKKGCK